MAIEFTQLNQQLQADDDQIGNALEVLDMDLKDEYSEAEVQQLHRQIHQTNALPSSAPEAPTEAPAEAPNCSLEDKPEGESGLGGDEAFSRAKAAEEQAMLQAGYAASALEANATEFWQHAADQVEDRLVQVHANGFQDFINRSPVAAIKGMALVAGGFSPGKFTPFTLEKAEAPALPSAQELLALLPARNNDSES